MTFSVSWLLCVNFFKAGVELVILALVLVVIVAVCNIKAVLRKWKVVRLLYVLPVIGCFVPYLINTGSLYSWTKVLQPITLGG